MFLNIAVLETAKVKICIYSFLILPNYKYTIKITFYHHFINTITLIKDVGSTCLLKFNELYVLFSFCLRVKVGL